MTIGIIEGRFVPIYRSIITVQNLTWSIKAHINNYDYQQKKIILTVSLVLLSSIRSVLICTISAKLVEPIFCQSYQFDTDLSNHHVFEHTKLIH